MQLSFRDMKVRVITLVREEVRKYASTPIPTFDEIRNGLGLDVKEGKLSPDIDGLLQGHTIVINTRIQYEERKQFTRFHEVTHHLIKEDEELFSTLHDLTWSRNGKFDATLEELCNIGAAEFLMPREEFTKLYKEKRFNVQLIPFASSHFRSSAIATTIQLAVVAPHSCITAVCEYGLMPSKTTASQAHLFGGKHLLPKPKLHVVYSASSPATKYRLARYTGIPNDHLINQAFSEGDTLEGDSDVPFPSGNRMPCSCEALPHGNRVYVLFHLTTPPNPNQLELI